MKSHITKKKHFKNKKKRFTRRLKNKKYMKGGAIESSSTPPIKPVPPTPPAVPPPVIPETPPDPIPKVTDVFGVKTFDVNVITLPA